MHAQAMADEPRWRRVEDAAQHEAAARCDDDDLLLVIGRPAFGKRAEHWPLQLDAFTIVGVATPNNLVDEAAIGIEVIEVPAATQKQSILQRLLEMAVRTLDGAILVCDTQIVAGRCHAVMAHQLLIAQRQVFLGVALQVAECRRETVAAMLAWHSTEPPQRVLQPRRQRHIALAAEHHMGMLKAREWQPEVVEPMVQHDTRNRNAEDARIGAVRQTKTARGVVLTEDHIPLGSGECTPSAHSALQRASNVGGDLGMAAADFFEHCNRPDTRCRLQNRHNLAIPKRGQGVWPPPAAWCLLLRRQSWIILDAVAAGPAEAGPAGRTRRVVG